jgi:hypothetical protein
MRPRPVFSSFQYATPRFTPFIAFAVQPASAEYGSNVHVAWPVAASSATTFDFTVVMYITPSTTIGVHSMVLLRPGRPSPV